MRFYKSLLVFTAVSILTGYVCWPVIHPYLWHIRLWLIVLKDFCHQNPLLGYVFYSCLFGITLFVGLPFAIAIMLFAGLTYSFWEATFLIVFCRLVVAIIAFIAVRRMINVSAIKRPQPVLIKKFERHPKVGLLLARLSPLPDTTINYAMGTSSLNCMQYTLISLIGMIPMTLLCVWTGGRLGSVSKLIHLFG